MSNFKKWVQEQINLHPNLKQEILDFFWLCIDEIHDGGSERHEIDLAIGSINELIADANEPQVGWDVAKNHPHDISGIINPIEYWYKKEEGIYYPQLRK
jgi:hypothetical protein